MPFDPSENTKIALVSLAELAKGGSWRLSLAHDRDHHLLIWITRGQGMALIDGARRGVGIHNALFIPARHLMAFDLGRQGFGPGFGQALVIPADTLLTLPTTPQHLRIRDVTAHAEISLLLEALGREQNTRRALFQSAVLATAELVAIWLHRQIDLHLENNPPPRSSAGRTLSRAFCARLVTDYASPADMGDHAAALGVTPTHLARVCRAEIGTTAAKLLAERHVHAARQLLGETDVPVLDIARHLGFGSAAYFTRFIKAHTGLVPTALRRNVQNRQP
ncbi:MAG: helix-turn-helix domain-containing protein [Rhodobacteraceae bacterium]|nr:helix-turn-helix domain-containing protein [Paracoccaceae bacterium]